VLSLAARGAREGDGLRIPPAPRPALDAELTAGEEERSGLPRRVAAWKRSGESNEKAWIAYRGYLDVLARCVLKKETPNFSDLVSYRYSAD